MRIIRSYAEFLEAIDGLEPRCLGARPVAGIAGPPASGKSTLLERLMSDRPRIGALPMDGFHMSNEWLSRRGRLERKGAPDTFDALGFKRALEMAAGGGALSIPLFDRESDSVMEGARMIDASCPVVVAEGNYLLHDGGDWAGTRGLFDLVFYVDTPIEVVERRLLERWRGLDLPEEEVERRVYRNDLPNARVVLPGRRHAGAVVDFVSG